MALEGVYTKEFVYEEFKKLKTNKAPGPDGTIIEYIKYLDDENLEIIMSLLLSFNSI